MNATRRDVLLLTLLCGLAFFAGLGGRDLWNPVEPRYAGITAEMLRGGHYLVPDMNGVVYDQKPPIFFWMAALPLSLAESDAARRLAVRLPSAVGGLLLVLLTYAIGRRLALDRGVCFLGAAFLATSWLTFWSSRFCHIDTLTASALAAALLAFLTARDSERSRRLLWLVFAGLALGLGMLLKGFGTPLFAAAVLALEAAFARDGGRLRRAGFPLALGVAALLALAWFVPAWREAGTDWARSMVLREGLGHMTDDDNAEKHGRYYYLGVFWQVSAPWALALVPALFLWFRRRSPMQGPAATFLVAWLLGVFVVLNFGTTFRSRYLLPLHPPAMLLAAQVLLPWRRVLSPLVWALAAAAAIWGLFVYERFDNGHEPAVQIVREQVLEGRRLVAVGSYHDKESSAGYWGFYTGALLGGVDREGLELARLVDREALVVVARAKDLSTYPRCIPPGYRPLISEVGLHKLSIFVNDDPRGNR